MKIYLHECLMHKKLYTQKFPDINIMAKRKLVQLETVATYNVSSIAFTLCI